MNSLFNDLTLTPGFEAIRRNLRSPIPRVAPQSRWQMSDNINTKIRCHNLHFEARDASAQHIQIPAEVGSYIHVC